MFTESKRITSSMEAVGHDMGSFEAHWRHTGYKHGAGMLMIPDDSSVMC